MKTQCDFTVTRALACELVPLWLCAFVDKLFHYVRHVDVDGAQGIVCDHVMIPNTNRQIFKLHYIRELKVFLLPHGIDIAINHVRLLRLGCV